MATLKAFALLLGAVAVAASVLVASLAVSTPIPAPTGPAHLRLDSVAVSPEPVVPGSEVNVSAQVTGVLHPRVYVAYGVEFVRPEAGAVAMVRVAGDLFSARIGPFGEGAHVWLFVAAFVGEAAPVSSEPTAFVVGDPPPGGVSTLQIAGVAQSPMDPRFAFQDVSVSADVTSSAAIQSVTLTYVRVRREGGDGATVAMAGGNGSPYFANIPRWEGSDAWVLVGYRIAASDAAGSRAVTAVRMYLVEMPRPVP